LTRAASGYRAALLSHAIRLGCKIAGVVILARVVSPADHGRFAMAASVTFLLALFRDFGTSATAIQAPGLTEGQMTALWRLHLALGGVLTVVTLLIAPLASSFYNEAELRPLLAVMSTSFLLTGASSWPRTLLAREIRFNELNRIETAGAVCGTLGMIAAGFLGAGAYAFVVFLLGSEAVMLIGAWRYCRWRPKLHADWQRVRELGETGLQLTGYNLLLYGLQQADTLLMGRWFGPVALGLYNRAGQLLAQPATHLAAPFTQVLLSTLSRLGRESPAFAAHFRATTNTIAYFTLPVAIVCLVLPAEIVRLVLGVNWPDAAPLLAWLSVSAIVSFLTATLYALCVATGHSARLAQLAAVALPITLMALWLGRTHGPVGVAAGLAGANLLLVVPRLWWSTRHTPVTLGDYAAALVGPIVVSGVLALGLMVGRMVTPSAGFAVRLGVAGVCGIVAVGLCAVAWPRVRGEFHAVWRHLPVRRAPIVK
jgi:polysaccharide transporter, PST family